MRGFSVILLAAALALAGCDSGESAKVKDVVRENTEAMNARDVARVMATMDSRSEGYAKKQKQLAVFFQNYDVAYKLADVSVIRIEPSEAEVKFVQEAVRKSGPSDFRDYRAEGRHFLRKDGGQWKIYETVVDYNEYLYK